MSLLLSGMKYDIYASMSKGNWVRISLWPLPEHLCKSRQDKSSSDKLLTSSWASLQVRPSQVKINCWPLSKHLSKSSSTIANLVPNTPSDDTLVQRSAYSLRLFCMFFLGHYKSQTFNKMWNIRPGRCDRWEQGRCAPWDTTGWARRLPPARLRCNFHICGQFYQKTFDFSSKWILKFDILDLETCGIPLPRRASRDCSTSKAI